MTDILIGTEAIASGIVTSHQLRRWYRPIHPNVHAPRDRELTLHLRTVWPGLLILNPRHTAEQPSITSAVARVIEDGTADLVSLGRLFLANPDLPGRLRAGGPFNRPDPATFYGGDARGYTDYPAAAVASAA